jgi:hypothetical protein
MGKSDTRDHLGDKGRTGSYQGLLLADFRGVEDKKRVRK